MLQRRVDELELNMSAYNVLEKTNISLRDRVDELIKQLQEAGEKHAEEIHRMRKGLFNHKMALEQVRVPVAVRECHRPFGKPCRKWIANT